MGWIIRVGNIEFAQDNDADKQVNACERCLITSKPGHTFAQFSFNPTTKLANCGSNANYQAQAVWQNILSDLVGM